MPGYAQSERRALTDLLLEVGPDAPTLCEGWTTKDLAAHLVLRERRPDAAAGILLGPVRGYTARVQRQLRDRPFPALVESVRSGPPPLLRPVDEQMNVVEMFVHHEDVRRAAPGAEPRTLEAGEEHALWRRLAAMARLVRRRVPVGLTLEAPRFGRLDVRTGEPRVTVTGPPGELVLFMSGRRGAARVDTTGPADARSRLDGARLGL